MRPSPLRTLLLPLLVVLAGALAAAAAPPEAESPNALANPGFEEGVAGHDWMPAGWDTSRSGLNTVFFGRDTFNVHGGRYAVSVANASNLYTMAPNWNQMLLVGPEQWGKDLVLSAWTRSVGVDGRAYIKVDAYQDTVSKMAKQWGKTRDDAAMAMRIKPIDDPLLDLAWQRVAFSEPETGWEKREARVYLPPSTNVVYVRAGIIGIGQLVVDDITLRFEPARPPAPLPLKKNLLVDPGFELSGNDWEYSIPPYPDIRAERDSSVVHGGKYSIRFTSPPTAMVPGPAGVAQVLCNRDLAGKRVRFRAFIKPDSLRSTAFIKLQCKSASGMTQEVSRNVMIVGTMPWTEAKLEMDVPIGTYEVWAWINYTAPTRGRVWFDDSHLEVIGPATSTSGSRE